MPARRALVDFVGRFADAGEDDALHGFGRGGEDAIQFAAGDDVEACAVLGEELEDGERRVGFDGVADQVIARGERLLKKREALKDLVGRVDVERRAEFAGEGFERNLAATESAFGAGMVKRASRTGGQHLAVRAGSGKKDCLERIACGRQGPEGPCSLRDCTVLWAMHRFRAGARGCKLLAASF